MEIGKPEKEVEAAPPETVPLSIPWSSPATKPLDIGEPVREIEIAEPELEPSPA